MRILCGEIRILYYLCSRKAKAYISKGSIRSHCLCQSKSKQQVKQIRKQINKNTIQRNCRKPAALGNRHTHVKIQLLFPVHIRKALDC